MTPMLPDLLPPRPRVIFCGTAAGHVSAARGHYYAGPGNRFWAMLAETGLTPRLLRPDEDALMPGLGYGMTDLAKEAAGMDHEIPEAAYAPSRIDRIVTGLSPRAIAFTSLAAGRRALGRGPGDRSIGPGRQAACAGWPGTAIFVLPSPSGAARRSFQPGPWHDLAAWLHRA